MMTATADLSKQAQLAEQLLGRADALALGQPIDEVQKAAAAVDALTAALVEALFPRTLTPVSDACLREFEMAVSAGALLPFDPISPLLLELHASSVDRYAELAEVVRSVRGRRLVALRARNSQAGDAEREALAEAAALQAFMRALAAQLAERNLFLPASRLFAEVIPDFAARLRTIERRHEEFAIADSARRVQEDARAHQAQRDAADAEEKRQWAERLKAEQLGDADALQRRRDLAAFFARHAEYVFVVDGVSRYGDQCSTELLAGAEFIHFYRAQSSGSWEPRRAARQ